ncbi:hypothetical protein EK904_001700 [Melospiza melodia maxima]|nr:hypothetical protein EK904_001700 [Melospiza melodia maxima]
MLRAALLLPPTRTVCGSTPGAAAFIGLGPTWLRTAKGGGGACVWLPPSPRFLCGAARERKISGFGGTFRDRAWTAEGDQAVRRNWALCSQLCCHFQEILGVRAEV